MLAFRRFMLGRMSDEALCRRLSLEGWERLTAAEDLGKGVILVTEPDDLWQIAIPVVGRDR